MRLSSEQKTIILKMQSGQNFLINEKPEVVDRVDQLPNGDVHIFFDGGKQLIQIIEHEARLIRIYRWNILGSKGEFWRPQALKQFSV